MPEYNPFMSIDGKTFSANLVRWRKKRGLTQSELAQLSSLSTRMIGHYEKHVSCPSIEKINSIAQALGIDAAELMASDAPHTNDEVSFEGAVDVRLIKRFKTLVILNKHDRSAVYKFVDSLLQKPEYKDKVRQLEAVSKR